MTSSARPRVAVVVPKYGTVGGGERFVFELTERLARDGRFEIHVIANRWVPGPGPVVFHGIPRIPFPRFPRQALFAWLAGREVERGNFDLVHAHDRIFRADVFTMHSIPHETWVRDIRKRRPTLFDRVTARVERRMMEQGGCVRHLPVSSIAGEAYRKMYRVDPSRMRVLHPGVDLARFSSPDRDERRREVRARYGIGSSEVVVLFVGMNFEVKGLDAILRAVARAKAMRTEASLRLLVVGRGNEGKYRALASSLGIADSVAFAGTQAEGVEAYYLASDLFMLLSSFDTFGMVVLEAMASRLPVIVSGNVGAKDLVEDGVSGYILPDRTNADDAAGKIVHLLDPQRRVAMGEAGRRMASLHGWDRLAEAVGGVYEEVIASKRNAAGGFP
ncbi:MAG: glycosyltransferase family 4 protein [Deltaproteobacteria bacterium]|nr:glycosyltransferase family 4 protein [Deltaproteobacteria bacterium]